MGGGRVLSRFVRGVGFALRSGAAPIVVGVRLASRRRAEAPVGLPAPRRGLALASKIALDEFFFATEMAAAPLVRVRDRARLIEELARALDLFEERGWLDDPASYHRTPPPLRRARLEPRRSARLAYECLSFESGYEPHPGEPGRERWLGYEANRTAYAWVLRHRGRARPWLVCIPGYRMGHPLVDFTGFRARWLHRHLGLNVAIPVLPLHGPRRTGRRGGNGYFSGDFIDTVHAQAQALWDVRRLIGWLRANDAPRIGTYGLSLGAYTTALLAAMEQDLDCVVAGIPAADFARLVRSHVPERVLRAAGRLGFSFERVERLLRVVSPFAFEPRVPGERCYLFAGLVDRLANPEQARDLWEHWGRPHVRWYHGSHVSFVWESEVRELLLEALSSQGLLTHSPA
jgi:hypothetical protein